MTPINGGFTKSVVGPLSLVVVLGLAVPKLGYAQESAKASEVKKAAASSEPSSADSDVEEDASAEEETEEESATEKPPADDDAVSTPIEDIPDGPEPATAEDGDVSLSEHELALGVFDTEAPATTEDDDVLWAVSQVTVGAGLGMMGAAPFRAYAETRFHAQSGFNITTLVAGGVYRLSKGWEVQVDLPFYLANWSGDSTTGGAVSSYAGMGNIAAGIFGKLADKYTRIRAGFQTVVPTGASGGEDLRAASLGAGAAIRGQKDYWLYAPDSYLFQGTWHAEAGDLIVGTLDGAVGARFNLTGATGTDVAFSISPGIAAYVLPWLLLGADVSALWIPTQVDSNNSAVGADFYVRGQLNNSFLTVSVYSPLNSQSPDSTLHTALWSVAIQGGVGF